MAEYRARLLTRTGTAGPILKPGDLTYGLGLNNSGRCSFTASLDHPGLTESSIEPWANEVLLLRRKNSASAWQVAHDGPIIASDCDDDSGTVTLTAGTVSAWLGRRNQRRTVGIGYGITAVDLDKIAEAIFYLAQHPEPPYTYAARNFFGVNYEVHLTGTTRRYVLPARERVNWLEELNHLASGDPGFDWDILTTWDGTTRSRIARTWAQRGTAVATPLVRGRGMVGLKVSKSGERAANYVESIGNGGTALVSDAKQSTTNQDTYGLLEHLDTGSEINVKARLNDRANRQLRLRKPPTRVLSAGYVVDEDLPWRFATVGDTIPVRGTRGPLVVSGTYRIAADEVVVSAGGQETVTLTFQDPLE